MAGRPGRCLPIVDMKPMPIILLIAGIAIGFLAGRGSTPTTGDGHGRAERDRGSNDDPIRSLGNDAGIQNTGGSNPEDEEGAMNGDAREGEDSPGIAALKSAFDGKRGKRRLFNIQSALYNLSLEEIQESWPLIDERIESDPESWEWASAYFSRWAELDKDEAIEKAKTLESWRGMRALNAIAQTWADTDPAGALNWAATNEDRTKRSYIYNGVLSTIAQSDKSRAFDLAVKAIDDKIIDGASWWGVGFFSEWAREDPAVAAAKALELPNDRIASESLEQVIEVWGKKSPEDAMKWLDAQGDKALRNRMLREIVDGWADDDPEAALAFAAKVASEESERGPLRTALGELVEKDLDAAKAWVDSLEDESLQEEARLTLMDRYMWQDPQKAANYLLEFSDDPRFMSKLQETAWNWARADPNGAFDWAMENLPAGDQRGQFLERIVRSWGEIAPDKAVGQLDQITEPKRREDAYKALAQSWADNDLESARTWAETIPDGPERDHAIAGVVAEYAQKNPFAASEWLQEFPAGDSRDRAVSSFVGQILEKDPQGAWDWSQSITDPRRRAMTMENTARRLLQFDRETYEPMIRASESLSEDAKWRMLDAN